MPLDWRIDDSRRLIVAVGHGTLTDTDVFGYQHSVWSRPEVSGYDELVDMSRVLRIALPPGERVRELAEISAHMDEPATRSKFAIVAPSDVAFGLGRVFQSYRGLMKNSTKDVEVFRTMEDALRFLGVDDAVSPPEPGFGS